MFSIRHDLFSYAVDSPYQDGKNAVALNFLGTLISEMPPLKVPPEYQHHYRYAMTSLAAMLQGKKQHELAIKALQQCLLFDSSNFLILNMLAENYKKIGDLKKSGECYELSTTLYPNQFDPSLRLAKYYESAGFDVL